MILSMQDGSQGNPYGIISTETSRDAAKVALLTEGALAELALIGPRVGDFATGALAGAHRPPLTASRLTARISKPGLADMLL